MLNHCLPLLTGLLLTSGTAVAQDLLVPESSNDAVMLFSGVDGSLIDASYLDLTTSTGTAPSTPIEAIEVGAEIWISDQVADVIFRFDDAGNYLGEYAAGRDNMRGIGVANGSVWVTNSGTGGSGYGDALKEYDTSGGLLNVYDVTAVGDPFDVIDFNGGLLVADISGEDLELFDYAGNNLGIFHDSDGVTGIDFPEQLAIRGSNGNVLAAGFSTPSGIYEYDAGGNEVAYYDTSAQGQGGVRGVHELQNGNFLFTNGSGVHVWDVGTGTVSTVLGGVSARFITEREPVGGPIGTNYCGPGNLNSTGQSGVISAFGTTNVGDNNVRLDSAQLPPGKFAYYLNSQTQGFVSTPPGSQGNLCLGGDIGRYVAQVGAIDGAGTFSLQLDLTMTPTPNGFVAVQAGETWNFQCWHRDDNPNQTSNFTDGIEIQF